MTRSNALPSTIDKLLQHYFPKDMQEFSHSPWNFIVLGPKDLADAATIIVYLEFGKTQRIHSRKYVLTFGPEGVKAESFPEDRHKVLFPVDGVHACERRPS